MYSHLKTSALKTFNLCDVGLNIVLISRTQQKLEQAATDISAKYKVETKIVAADLSQHDNSKWTKIAATISPLDVGILVNNAGRSYDHAEYFDAVDDELIDSLLEINIQAINKVKLALYQASGLSCLPNVSLDLKLLSTGIILQLE